MNVWFDKLPKNCTECPCMHFGEYAALEKSFCNLQYGIDVSDKKRPSNCPAKLICAEMKKQPIK